MENKVLLIIDTIPEITLLKESIRHLKLPLDLKYATSVNEANETIKLLQPDLLIIGSSFVLHGDFEHLLSVDSLPIAILCESIDIDCFLKDRQLNLSYITRPLEIDKIPEMIEKAYDFLLSNKES